jgi:hypothetical protein
MSDVINLLERNVEQALSVARNSQSDAGYVAQWAADTEALWKQKPEIAINWIMVAAVVANHKTALESKALALFSEYVDSHARGDWVSERREATRAAEEMPDDGSQVWLDQVRALYKESRARAFIEALNTAKSAAPESLLAKWAISCRDGFAYGLAVQLDISTKIKSERPEDHKLLKPHSLSKIRRFYGFV